MNWIIPSGLGAPSIGLSIIGGAAGGFAAGVAATGTLKGGLQGAFSGAVFGAIGGAGAAGGWGSEAFVAAHAAGGCITSVAGGGKCGSGALSAAFGKYTTLAIDDSSFLSGDLAKGIASVAAGGVGSVIAGGKFENGATTAAFGYLFNHLSHWAELAAHGREAHTLLQNEMAQNGYTVESKCAGTNCVNGRFDIADANTAEVWEIKRNSIFGHLMGQFSLDAYTDNTGLSRGGNLVGMRVGGSMTLMTNQATYTYTNFGGGLIGYTRDSITTPSKLPAPGPFMLPGRGGRLLPR
jgi:hypothetical protein